MESSPTKRSIYSFSAGPSQLPREIILRARDELLNWKSTGFSVLEVSHRGKEFEDTLKQAEANLRKLLNVPKNFKILFMQGGASLQFAMIPMNLLKGKKSVNYLTTGQWSIKAYEEASKYAKVNQVRPLPKDKKYNTVPDPSTWSYDPEAAYFHYCDNETIDGVEFQYVPDSKGQLLICDMSSNIASKEIDWSKYAVVYAGAQKNLGPSGVTIVIVREDLLDKNVLPITPTMCNWKIAADNGSMYNTPPVFAIYMANLYFEHMLAEGGVAHFQKLSEQKSKLIYDVIDGSKGFYVNPVDKKFRSRMNVVFRVKNDEKLENEFVAEAKKVGLIELKGHRSVGGIRASIYNGMPLDAIVKFCDFMVAFMKKKNDASPKL